MFQKHNRTSFSQDQQAVSAKARGTSLLPITYVNCPKRIIPETNDQKLSGSPAKLPVCNSDCSKK